MYLYMKFSTGILLTMMNMINTMAMLIMSSFSFDILNAEGVGSSIGGGDIMCGYGTVLSEIESAIFADCLFCC